MECFPSEIINHLTEKTVLKLPFLCTPRILLHLLSQLEGKTIVIDMAQIFIDKIQTLEVNRVYETKKFIDKKINIVKQHGYMPIHCDVLITENLFPEYIQSDISIVVIHENGSEKSENNFENVISVTDSKLTKNQVIDFIKLKNICSFYDDKWIQEYIKQKKDEIVLIHTNEKVDFDALILPFYQSKENHEYNSLIIVKDFMYGFSVVIDDINRDYCGDGTYMERLILNSVHFSIVE